MDSTNKGKANTILTTIFVLTAIVAIGISFYRYYYTKNYQYLLEASCDPLVELCFIRDCSNPDNCPPNQLSIYKEFQVKASDFALCSDNSCREQCEAGTIDCEVLYCDTNAGDECTSIPQEEIVQPEKESSE